ncbi:MAG: photosynthetic reaction center cytochrome c subunit [Bdellovibrionales bacterium]|nr:photosynthetic reaction center cytochrome c subunit [Ramlibacter sp.]
MRMTRTALCATALAFTAFLSGCERPPVNSVQRGYRGTGMVEVYNPRVLASQAPSNALPQVQPPASPDGPKASQVYQNVKVLGDLSVGEFTRVMLAMTAWVAPQQGCTYCHAAEGMASDALYTKVVARRMLEMTRHINSDWKTHVAETGVTCYTCHRGQPVPSKVWFTAATQKQATGMVGNDAGQNKPAVATGLSSLPYDPYTPFLLQTAEIRVAGTTALQTGNRHSIKQTEHTYGLMMHMSDSLGVNCTYCHNSRSFSDWDQSTPQRGTAWYGIRMAGDLNVNYMAPLTSTFPPNRLGPTGDVAKVNCATCHQGAFKPLYGASMLKDYPELSGAHSAMAPAAAASGAAAAPAAPTVALAAPAAPTATK